MGIVFGVLIGGICWLFPNKSEVRNKLHLVLSTMLRLIPTHPPYLFFHIAHCSGHVITQNTTNTCKIIKLKFNFISVNQALGQTSPPRICE